VLPVPQLARAGKWRGRRLKSHALARELVIRFGLIHVTRIVSPEVQIEALRPVWRSFTYLQDR
jgi:hypothetical protein